MSSNRKLTVLLDVLVAGFATSFFVAATLFAGAFLAATLAFVLDEVPVTDYNQRHQQ
jgi:hypothetical protein